MDHRRAFHVLISAAASAALACASAPARPPAAGARSGVAPAVRTAPTAADAPAAAEPGGLSFSVEPGDAEVLIDGRSYGKVAELARSGTLPLQPGLYQVSLRRTGYATWRAEVAVGAAVEPIRVTLSRRPTAP